MEYRIELYWPVKERKKSHEYTLWVHPRKKARVDRIPAGSKILFYETAKRPGEPWVSGSKTIFAVGKLTDRHPREPIQFKDHKGRMWTQSRIVELSSWVPPERGISLSEIRRVLNKKPQWKMRQGPHPVTASQYESLNSILIQLESGLNSGSTTLKKISFVDGDGKRKSPETSSVSERGGHPAEPQPKNVSQKDEEASVREQAESVVEIRKEHNRLINLFAHFCRTRVGLKPEEARFDMLLHLKTSRRSLLIEAKSSAHGSLGRHQIRQAIGQLFDYRFSDLRDINRNVSLAVLLPHEPTGDIVRLLQSLDIGLIWKENDSFVGTEDVRRLCGSLRGLGRA